MRGTRAKTDRVPRLCEPLAGHLSTMTANQMIPPRPTQSVRRRYRSLGPTPWIGADSFWNGDTWGQESSNSGTLDEDLTPTGCRGGGPGHTELEHLQVQGTAPGGAIHRGPSLSCGASRRSGSQVHGGSPAGSNGRAVDGRRAISQRENHPAQVRQVSRCCRTSRGLVDLAGERAAANSRLPAMIPPARPSLHPLTASRGRTKWPALVGGVPPRWPPPAGADPGVITHGKL